MDEIKIYIKGTPGFKSAVRTKLGGTWIHGGSDINTETTMFLLPADTQIDAFRTAIGEDLTSEFKLQFLTDLPEADVQKRTTMSIWTNNDSKIKGSKSPVPH